MGVIIILSVSILAVLSTCLGLLFSFTAIVVWWAMLFLTIKWVCKIYDKVGEIIVLTVNGLEDLMTNNIPAFLWYVVFPIIFLLHICSLLLYIMK